MATANRLTPLQELGRALVGEKRWTLAAANAMGYYSVAQIAAETGCDPCVVWRRIKRDAAKYEAVKIAGRGGGHAYRLK